MPIPGADLGFLHSPPMGRRMAHEESPACVLIPPPPIKRITRLSCPRQTDLMYNDDPGFFRRAVYRKAPRDMLAPMFNVAIGRRCAAGSSRI